MKGNINKCHLLMNKDKSSEIHLGESIMKVSDYGKPLGTKIAWKLRYDDHVQNLYKEANMKLRVAQATIFVYLEKWKLGMYSFFIHNLFTTHCIVIPIVILIAPTWKMLVTY